MTSKIIFIYWVDGVDEDAVAVVTHLVMPLLVAMMRTGAMSSSRARLRKEKLSMSSMWTSSMKSTWKKKKSTEWIVSSQNGLSAIFEYFKVRPPSYDTKWCLSMIPTCSSLQIKVYIWSYDQKSQKFSYYFLYLYFFFFSSFNRKYLKIFSRFWTRWRNLWGLNFAIALMFSLL